MAWLTVIIVLYHRCTISIDNTQMCIDYVTQAGTHMLVYLLAFTMKGNCDCSAG